MLFERILTVGWGQTDFNGHLRNSAFLDMCSDVRLMFFAANGFPASRFAEAQFGPVVQSDRLDYFREAKMLDAMRVTLRLAGLAGNGSRFQASIISWYRLLEGSNCGTPLALTR